VARLLSTTEAEHRGAFSLLDWTAFVGIGAIWGSSFLLIAVGLESLEPGFVTWFRIAAGAAVLWLVPDARGRLDRSDRVRIVAVSFLWVAIPLTLFPLAQRSVSSAVAGMLNGGVPLVTAAIASVMLRRPPGRAQAVGLALGFAGVVMIALPAAGEGSSQAFGVAMIVAAVVCYGLAINVVAPLQQRYGSARVMARMIGLGAVWTAPFGAIGLVGSSFAWRPVLAIAVLGAIGTGLAFVLMSGLVGRVGGTRASFATYLIPVVALVLGVTIRDDRVSAVAVSGVACVIAGAILASRPDRGAPVAEAASPLPGAGA
jgi:drug/metabolite transporter (DMT)-like permease